jgi:atypical dual specificity phosphatase
LRNDGITGDLPMTRPHGFTWVDKPLLAGMARPESLEEMNWLRQQGIDLLVSLTEDPPRHDWVNDAGLLLVHCPVEDMSAPTQQQLDRCLSAITRANEHKLGVAVHCGAGLGRTGVILACYFVEKGMSARDAIARVRQMRPGSIETTEQSEAITEYARRRRPAPE